MRRRFLKFRINLVLGAILFGGVTSQAASLESRYLNAFLAAFRTAQSSVGPPGTVNTELNPSNAGKKQLMTMIIRRVQEVLLNPISNELDGLDAELGRPNARLTQSRQRAVQLLPEMVAVADDFVDLPKSLRAKAHRVLANSSGRIDRPISSGTLHFEAEQAIEERIFTAAEKSLNSLAAAGRKASKIDGSLVLEREIWIQILTTFGTLNESGAHEAAAHQAFDRANREIMRLAALRLGLKFAEESSEGTGNASPKR